MSQYVKWDFNNSKILRGPQMSPGEGEDWLLLLERGKVINYRTQTVVYTFDPDLNAIIASIEGSPKLIYDQARKLTYGSLGAQLDMLWHDIDAGTLDKTGNFYNYIKQIKEKNPK